MSWITRDKGVIYFYSSDPGAPPVAVAVVAGSWTSWDLAVMPPQPRLRARTLSLEELMSR